QAEVSVWPQEPQAAQVADRHGLAVNVAIAYCPGAKADDPARLTMTRGYHLAKSAGDHASIEVARLAAKADRDFTRHRRLLQNVPEIGVIGRRGDLKPVLAHTRVQARTGRLPVAILAEGRCRNALQYSIRGRCRSSSRWSR